MFSAEGTEVWRQYVEQYGLVERIEKAATNNGEVASSTIVFKDGSILTGIDVIIFATGYEYCFPFFKADDHPWSDPDIRPVDDQVGPVEAVPMASGSEAKETKGLRGLGMRHLDELMMFLQEDRSMALLGLGRLSAINRMVMASADTDGPQYTKWCPSLYSRYSRISLPFSGPTGYPAFQLTPRCRLIPATPSPTLLRPPRLPMTPPRRILPAPRSPHTSGTPNRFAERSCLAFRTSWITPISCWV